MSNTNLPINPFKKGNQYYKLVTHIGRPKRFNNPDDLWKSATAYIAWCVENPHRTQASRRGKLITILKNREMSFKDLHIWLEVSNLYYYQKMPEFSRVAHRINNVVHHYNYVHAAVGFIKGRSVGHSLRKPKHGKRVNPTTLIADDVATIAAAPFADTRKERCIDTKKIRIIALISKKQQTDIKAQTQNTPIDTKKVRILKHSKNPIIAPINNTPQKSRETGNTPIDTKKVGIIAPINKTPQNQEGANKSAVDTRKVRIITQINKASQNREGTETKAIDTKKVRIPKQKLFTTTLPLANNIKRERSCPPSLYRRHLQPAPT